MIKSIFAQKDATIYKDIPTLNSGLDEVIEVRSSNYSITRGNYVELETDVKSVSRSLIKFDISAISESISAGVITNPKYYLKLYSTTPSRLQVSYDIEAYPISQSWLMGSGKRHVVPIITDGVSWYNRQSGSAWGEYGATWYSAYSASQSFDYEKSDILMDVTNIVSAWVSGTIPNEGFIIKFPTSVESSSVEYGTINFFSRDTNTIYPPLLQVKWNDSVYNTGSNTVVDVNNMTVIMPQLREKYKYNEIVKIPIFVRDKYPTKSFVTSSRFLVEKCLPSSSYYAVKDAHTEDILIPFDTGSTKISYTSGSGYFNFDMSGLQPQRYYEFILKVEQNSNVLIVGNKFYFRVER